MSAPFRRAGKRSMADLPLRVSNPSSRRSPVLNEAERMSGLAELSQWLKEGRLGLTIGQRLSLERIGGPGCGRSQHVDDN
jgi:hypothetical protein